MGITAPFTKSCYQPQNMGQGVVARRCQRKAQPKGIRYADRFINIHRDTCTLLNTLAEGKLIKLQIVKLSSLILLHAQANIICVIADPFQVAQGFCKDDIC